MNSFSFYLTNLRKEADPGAPLALSSHPSQPFLLACLHEACHLSTNSNTSTVDPTVAALGWDSDQVHPSILIRKLLLALDGS